MVNMSKSEWKPRWNSPNQLKRYEEKARQRFSNYHIQKRVEECWPWIKGKDKHGYGRMVYRGKPRHAHIVCWMLVYGEIPEGQVVRHRCDNPICVNPLHLQLGTKADNSKDMVERGRSAKGEKHSQAKLTTKQALKVKILINKGFSDATIGNNFGVHRRTISDIRRNITWRHLDVNHN